MSRLIGIAVSTIVLMGTMGFAQAAYPCGEGYTLRNGYCRPYYGPHTPYGYGGYYYGGGPYAYSDRYNYRRHHKHHRRYYKDYRNW
jgi:hypothetical protein